jgi:hypothetical protein
MIISTIKATHDNIYYQATRLTYYLRSLCVIMYRYIDINDVPLTNQYRIKCFFSGVLALLNGADALTNFTYMSF